jgi:hypothetical protein
MARTLAGLLALTSTAGLVAQSYDQMNLVRNRIYPSDKMLEIKAGLLGEAPSSSDKTVGLDNEVGWDGHVYYRGGPLTGRSGNTEAYAGRDGAILSMRDGNLVGGDNTSRLELKTRYFPFYREGFYRGKNFVPVGRYEGNDFEAYLGFGKPASEDLTLELGGFWRKNTFSRNSDTAVNYVIPDNYSAYGIRLFGEQTTLQLDRTHGVPHDGYQLTAMAEREWNDSDRAFGVSGGFQTELPTAVWRGRGHLEWYTPGSDTITWVVYADAQLSDEKDRVVNYDAQHPQGNFWVDAELRMRWFISDTFVAAPFFQGQFLKILDDTGVHKDQKFFAGGGLELDLLISKQVTMNFWYSFLDNESRPPVNTSNDDHGQHMFFAGVILHFGGM